MNSEMNSMRIVSSGAAANDSLAVGVKRALYEARNGYGKSNRIGHTPRMWRHTNRERQTGHTPEKEAYHESRMKVKGSSRVQINMIKNICSHEYKFL